MVPRAMILTDLWTDSLPLEKCIKGLQEMGFEEYYLLQCIDKLEVPGLDINAARKSLHATMQKHTLYIREQGYKVDSDIAEGRPCSEIKRLAVEKECCIIVIGTHRHSRVYELFLGNPANDAVCLGILPVLLVPILQEGEKASFYDGHKYGFIERIVFPTDFSENSGHAFSYLEKYAEKGAHSFILMHVQHKGLIAPHLSHRIDEFNEKDEKRLEQMKKSLPKMSGTEIETRLSYGHPVKEIVSLAREKKATLIIMGFQGRGFLKEIMIGSVSQNVARCSDVPVLLVPTAEKDINS